MPNDMRGRLIELTRKAKKNTKGANCDLEREMLFADFLLANGVVVFDTDIVSPENRPLIQTFAEMPLNEVFDLVKANRLIRPFISKEETVEIISKSDADCSKWISVEDVLPPPFESVLVCMPGEAPLPMIHEGFINKEGVWYSNHFLREAGEVTHWQQIPEPPEKFKTYYTDGKEVANSG